MFTCNTLNTIRPAFIAGTAILTIISQPVVGDQLPVSPMITEEQVFESPAFAYAQIENSLILTGEVEKFEPVVEMPTTKRLKVKIAKPTPLTLQNIQDLEGMY